MKWNTLINTPTYNSWRAMRNRVLNNKNYKNVSICKEWKSFDCFVEDMGERPKGTSLDRINNSGNYEPCNCRWATMKTQQNNKSGLTKITHNEETLTIGEWVTKLNLNKKQRNTVYRRHCSYGATTFDELFTPNKLSSLRVKNRVNKCEDCKTEKTCKWRKEGTQCNTCWHKKYRKNTKDDIQGYAGLPKKFNHGVENS